MSRRSPTGFVFSVTAEVIAVVFIVSVLPRVDLRRSADAAPNGSPASEVVRTPLPLPQWGQTVDGQPNAAPRETSYYERKQQTAAIPREPSRERDVTSLIAVDPAKPGYVEQRLDRASQDLVNTVGTYVSQAATDLLQVQPPPQRGRDSMAATTSHFGTPIPPSSPDPLRLQYNPPSAGSFSTNLPSQPHSQPRPWMRY